MKFKFTYKDIEDENGEEVILAKDRESAIAVFEDKYPTRKWYQVGYCDF